MIDTHTHLFLPNFNNDIDEVIERAFEKGIDKFILPNIDHDSIEPMLNLVSKYPNNCFPSMGLHPGSVKENYEKDLIEIENWLKKERFVAVGETGIDLYWDDKYKEQQLEAFREQVRMAKYYSLPIIIHHRNAFDEVYQIVSEENNEQLNGVFHCFTGTLEEANRIIELGFTLGIGGVVTFKNTHLREVIKEIDLSNIVLETDSPYLAPAPKRGKRNESAYILYIAEVVASVFNIPLNDFLEVVTNNSKQLFNISDS